jgi:hypothetical protein
MTSRKLGKSCLRAYRRQLYNPSQPICAKSRSSPKLDFWPSPQLSFGHSASQISYNSYLLGEILTVSYPWSVHQARDYKHNQQTNRSQKRAVPLGKQGSGVLALVAEAVAGLPHSATLTRSHDCVAWESARYRSQY